MIKTILGNVVRVIHKRTMIFENGQGIGIRQLGSFKGGKSKKETCASSTDRGDTLASKYIVDGQRGVEIDLETVEGDVEGAIDGLRSEYAKVHSGRTNMFLLEQISIKTEDGQSASMSNLGSMIMKDPQQVVINLFDQKYARSVVVALQTAKLNLTASVDGKKVTVCLPKMTKELREQIVKGLSQPAERTKNSIRQIRTILMKSLADHIKDLNLKRQAELSMQDIQTRAIKKIDEILVKKQKEVSGQ